MKTTALKAWAKSLPLALCIPVIVWMIFLASKNHSDFVSGALFVMVCPTSIHLVAYLITGLPIFLICYGRPKSAIWKLPIALLVGTALGAATLSIIFGTKNPSSLTYSLPVGAGYGLATAIAAWRQRPQLPIP